MRTSQCFLCWTEHQEKKLYTFDSKGYVGKLCLQCRFKLNRVFGNNEEVAKRKRCLLDSYGNIILNNGSGLAYTVIVSVNRLVLNMGIDRQVAIRLVLKNLNRLNQIDDIAREFKEVNTKHRFRLKQTDDIYERGFRLYGSFGTRTRR